MSLTFEINVVINTTLEFDIQMMITVSITLYLIWKRKKRTKDKKHKSNKHTKDKN